MDLISDAVGATNVPIPTLAEVATYGVNPGVLVAVLVGLAGFGIYFVFKFAMWFLQWHAVQMKEQREAHNSHMERFHNRLDSLHNLLNEKDR
jgi:hypothetical protein